MGQMHPDEQLCAILGYYSKVDRIICSNVKPFDPFGDGTNFG
jgi:hypothetical protein